MRTDVKIGIAVGVLVLLVAVIYVAATNDKKSDGKGGDVKIAKTGEESPKPEIKVEPVNTTHITPVAPAPTGDAPAASHDTTPITIVSPSSTTPDSGDVAPLIMIPPATGGTIPAQKYTAVRGDTFASIAQAKYGDASKGAEIARANHGVTAASLREGGMVLTIPELKKESTTPVGGTTPGSTTTGTYTVVAGDNFWKISEKQYGSNKYYNLIASANPTANSASLKIGQTLTIPPKPADSVATVGTTTILPAGAKEHTVVSGDNLSSISERYYGSASQWKLIASANPETKDGTVALKLGQKLVIPAAARSATPTTGPSRLVHSTPATTRPADRPVVRTSTPAGSSTASAAPARPDFSSRVR
ncbi:MAG: LysM peptidoglycan-binding domain-containing protein [Planctomycetaceae bacterium]|nr:MAG: LysM peptidoglycan-binding domain-containing protein [Planctomycetaceae bacterium]